MALLQLDQYVDLIIPRVLIPLSGLYKTPAPVLGHAEGICHLYVDKAADIRQ